MKRTLLLVPPLLAACSFRADHRWAGALLPTQAAPQCRPTKAVLLIRDGNVTFTPDEGTWVLNGVAGPKTLAATRSRPTADHKVYKTDLQAEWSSAAVQGTYTTPECTYRVDLSPY